MAERDNREDEKFRKLFIGGLNYKTTEETLKKYFEQWGEIVDCVVKKGFGFITYKTAEMLDDSQNNRPHKIDDRELDTKRVTSRNESNESQSSTKKIFVGGLKGDIEDDIKEVFSHFGKIDKLEMGKGKKNGKQLAFCFITFDDFDSVDKCLSRQRISLNGKYVEVKKAVTKDGDGSMGGGRGGRGGSRGGMRSRGGLGGANSGYNNGCGYPGNVGYPGNMGGGDSKGYGVAGYQGSNIRGGNQGSGHQGYGGGNQGSGHQGYGGGNQGSGHQGYGGGNQGSGHQGYGGGNQGSGNQGYGGGNQGSGHPGYVCNCL